MTPGAFLGLPVERALDSVAVNCRGPVSLCHLCEAPMAEPGRGGIVAMTSGAALAGSDYLEDGPSWIPGAHNGSGFEQLRPVPRRIAIVR